MWGCNTSSQITFFNRGYLPVSDEILPRPQSSSSSYYGNAAHSRQHCYMSNSPTHPANCCLFKPASPTVYYAPASISWADCPFLLNQPNGFLTRGANFHVSPDLVGLEPTVSYPNGSNLYVGDDNALSIRYIYSWVPNIQISIPEVFFFSPQTQLTPSIHLIRVHNQTKFTSFEINLELRFENQFVTIHQPNYVVR